MRPLLVRVSALRRAVGSCMVSSNSASSTAKELHHLVGLLPHELTKSPKQRALLARVVLELECVSNASKRLLLQRVGPTTSMASPALDQCLLLQLIGLPHFSHRLEVYKNLMQKTGKGGPSVSTDEDGYGPDVDATAERERRVAAGEVCYHTHHHVFGLTRGEAFRKNIDDTFGSRLLSAERCGESLPQLVIDCRFLTHFSPGILAKFYRDLQRLYDMNWTSTTPFNISVVNYRPSLDCEQLAKRFCTFLYGPPGAPDHNPHPLGPKILARGLFDNANHASRDSTIVVTNRSNQPLTRHVLRSASHIVLAAGNDLHPSTSGALVASQDRVRSFAFPIAKPVPFDQSLHVRAEMARAGLFAENDNAAAAMIRGRQNVLARFQNSQTLDSQMFLATERMVSELVQLDHECRQAEIEKRDARRSERPDACPPRRRPLVAPPKRIYTH